MTESKRKKKSSPKAPTTIREYMLDLLSRAIEYNVKDFINCYNFDLEGCVIRWWYIFQDKEVNPNGTPSHTLEEFLKSEINPEELIIPVMHSLYAYQFIDTLVDEYTDISPKDKHNYSIMDIQDQLQCFIKSTLVEGETLGINVGPNGNARIPMDTLSMLHEFIGYDIWDVLKEEEKHLGKLYADKTKKKIDTLQALGYVTNKDNQIFNGMAIGIDYVNLYLEDRMKAIGMDPNADEYSVPMTKEEISYMVLSNLVASLKCIERNVPTLDIEVTAGNIYNTLFVITYVEYKGKKYNQVFFIKHSSYMKYLV